MVRIERRPSSPALVPVSAPPLAVVEQAPAEVALDTVEPSAARLAAQPWIDAMRAREANAPAGVAGSLWKQTASLEKRGISADEVSNYLENGELAEMESLSLAIEEKGSWPDVECFTFLVGMRRAAMAAEKADAEKLLATIPADAAERAPLEQFIADCTRADKAMGSGLQAIYRTATHARERTQLEALGRADRMEARGDLEGAKRIRDRAARLLHEEALYRQSLPKARYDASSTFELAAGAQISRARMPGTDAPLFLGNTADAGNGAPGAGALIASAVAVQGEQDHGTLALEGARQDSFAQYFAGRGVSGRAAYFQARAKQADAAEARLALYGEPSRLSGGDALAAASVAQERRVVLEELGAPLAASLGTDRSLTAALARRDDLGEAQTTAGEELTRLQDEYRTALETADSARSQKAAVFGDSFKTSGEARRDQEAVADADFLVSSTGARVEQMEATHARFAPLVAESEATVAKLTAEARDHAADAEKVRRAISGTDVNTSFRALRSDADEAASLGEAYLLRADAELGSVEAERAISAGRIDLAAYGARAVELDLFATGDRTNATAKLDHAASLLASVRTDRPSLAAGAIDAHALIAEASSDYRPDTSRAHLAEAEALLAANPSEPAQERIGNAALLSFARSDARFEDIAVAGNYFPGAQDSLVAQARRMVPGDERLTELDAALDAVPEILSTSSTQIENGSELADAQTRSFGRSQIAVTQAQMSSLGTGMIWAASGWDMREDLAQQSEGVTALSLRTSQEIAGFQVTGQQQISAVYSQARSEGRPLEMLGALRLRGLEGSSAQEQQSAEEFIASRVPLFYSEEHATDYLFFNRTPSLQQASPLASALEGPVLGYSSALAAHGDPAQATVTPSMQRMLEEHGAWLEKSAEGMEMMIALNTTCEVGIGIAATWGVGSIGALAEGGVALNTARNGAQALSAARAFGMATRASELLGAAQAAHPFLYSAALTTTVGAGSLGASYGARKLFGASSGMSRGVDAATNFLPVGTGVRTTGIRGLMPAVGFGAAQTFGTALATPRIAGALGVESEGGRAAIGLALNILIPASAAAVLHKNPTASAVLAAEVASFEGATTDGAAILARLDRRLQTEGGLSKADAGSLTRSVERAVLEREVGARLSAEQKSADAPLTDARMLELSAETATHLGLDPQVARSLTERGPFCDWVRSFFVSPTSDAQFRDALLEVAGPKGKSALASISVDELRAIYPEGPFPWAFAELAEIKGFVDFAKTHPAEARAVADASGMYGITDRLRDNVALRGPSSWLDAGRYLAEQLPSVSQHPSQKGYEVIRRAPGTSNYPEVVFSPDPTLDHNGAFHQYGAGGKTKLPDFGRFNPMNVHGKDGRPLNNWDGIIQFSGHGSRSGFDIPTRDAAKMVAGEIIARDKSGARTEYVLLRACHQRDAGFIFFGESNGQRFRRMLHEELKTGGYRGPMVEVLAADRGGPTARFTQSDYFPRPELRDGWPTYRYHAQWAQYRPATYSVPYMSHEELFTAAASAGIVGASAVGAGAIGVGAAYYVVQSKKDERRKP